MNVVNEYVQVLDANTAVVSAKYTYMSEAMLRALYKTGWQDAYLSRIGWWYWVGDKAAALKTKIQSDNYTDYMVPDSVTFPVGRAMLGLFSGTSGLVFESSGEVPTEVTAYTAGTEKKPFILNYLPRNVDLNEITVSSTIANKYMNVVNEYIQILDSNTAVVSAKYTYMSEAMLRALYKTGWQDAYLSRIGWWYWVGDKAAALKTKIQSDNYADYMVADDVVVLQPGDGFLGLFSGSSGLQFNFPSATATAK